MPSERSHIVWLQWCYLAPTSVACNHFRPIHQIVTEAERYAHVPVVASQRQQQQQQQQQYVNNDDNKTSNLACGLRIWSQLCIEWPFHRVSANARIHEAPIFPLRLARWRAIDFNSKSIDRKSRCSAVLKSKATISVWFYGFAAICWHCVDWQRCIVINWNDIRKTANSVPAGEFSFGRFYWLLSAVAGLLWGDNLMWAQLQ